MPTYEYACAACGHQWEQVQRIIEAPVEICPSCTKSAAHRLISGGTNFILKGGGWYSDLYSSSKPSKGSDGTSSSASESPKTEGSAAADTKTPSDSKKTESKAAPSTTPSSPAPSNSSPAPTSSS